MHGRRVFIFFKSSTVPRPKTKSALIGLQLLLVLMIFDRDPVRGDKTERRSSCTLSPLRAGLHGDLLSGSACVPIRLKKPHLISEFLKTHVPLVDRALSEIPETKTNSFRYGHAVQVHAVAVGFGVI